MDVPLDENRAVDGLDLRETFINSLGKISIGPQDDLPCSILEMLIALAMRCNDWIICDVDDHYSEWFWTFLDNLGLLVYDDRRYNSSKVDDILRKWLDREYRFDGSGGLFPLANPEIDQRMIEIWSQLVYYLDENYF